VAGRGPSTHTALFHRQSASPEPPGYVEPGEDEPHEVIDRPGALGFRPSKRDWTESSRDRCQPCYRPCGPSTAVLVLCNTAAESSTSGRTWVPLRTPAARAAL
jgi:hypothetical protein